MKLLTLQEGADRLRFKRQTLYNRLSAGRAEDLKAFKVLGEWRIPEDAIDDIIKVATEWDEERAGHRRKVKGVRGRTTIRTKRRFTRVRDIRLPGILSPFVIELVDTWLGKGW